MIQKLKYINIIYTEKIESVKLMVQTHYDTPEYNNSLFILNTSWTECDCTEIINNIEKYTKKIYYSLEHKPNTVLIMIITFLAIVSDILMNCIIYLRLTKFGVWIMNHNLNKY